MTKYIFVTGGVVSGLGKGITAASLGRLLKARGYMVAACKLDPYMNVDPGTMSPYQHGEVFVTYDGAETDLDLGHYERFIDEELNKYSNLTSGKVYWNVLNRERAGEYLGETVQVIPHITQEIKNFVYMGAKSKNADILITEIGGTVGDIESQPFLEAIRQISLEVGRENCLFIHVTLVPYLSGSDEYKSKPTQHSVKELQSLGIAPNIIVTRSDGPIGESNKKKISLFCNVKEDCVIENLTLDSLYEAPMMLHEHGLDKVALRELALPDTEPDLTDWKVMLDKMKNIKGSVKIAIVGKYVQLHDAYLSVREALYHAGISNQLHVDVSWINSEEINSSNVSTILAGVDGVLIPGGFGERGVEGMIEACRYARESDIPCFGICLGMQVMVIEYARNVLGYKDADSGEFSETSEHKVIDLMEEQYGIVKKGGTMRLGNYPCKLFSQKLIDAYKTENIDERHRHRFEYNNAFKEELVGAGLSVAGASPDGHIVEAVECEKKHFHIGVQFHPEFKSRPNRPQPIFDAFVAAAYGKEGLDEA